MSSRNLISLLGHAVNEEANSESPRLLRISKFLKVFKAQNADDPGTSKPRPLQPQDTRRKREAAKDAQEEGPPTKAARKEQPVGKNESPHFRAVHAPVCAACGSSVATSLGVLSCVLCR